MPKTTLPRKTWQYSKEFKIKAVKLTLLYGNPPKKLTDIDKLQQENEKLKKENYEQI